VTGPLSGVAVVELVGIGPGPFAGMVLADLGADVVAVSRPAGTERGRPRGGPYGNPLDRARRSLVADLRRPEAVEVVLRLADRADVLVDPFRPGVAERLGVGPDACLARNPRLVYGRMTGWGQDGPYARHAGHDSNYIALAGALEGSGRAGDPPTFAQNMVGDFGGGGMLLLVGVLAALLEREQSGLGQVVDAAMVDGAALLTSFVRGMRAVGGWRRPIGK
jgi:alpha-methylacyl-CoA racemase